MMFRRETTIPTALSEGASFRRSRGSDIVETAQVLAVTSDSAGIPHVRFNLKIAGPSLVSEEQRTLAVEWFRTLYREPITA